MRLLEIIIKIDIKETLLNLFQNFLQILPIRRSASVPVSHRLQSVQL